MGIQRYVFFSIDKCDKHREVPLMNLKFCVEKYLEASGLNFTTLRITGFMQPLISAYAVPILEVRPAQRSIHPPAHPRSPLEAPASEPLHILASLLPAHVLGPNFATDFATTC